MHNLLISCFFTSLPDMMRFWYVVWGQSDKINGSTSKTYTPQWLWLSCRHTQSTCQHGVASQRASAQSWTAQLCWECPKLSFGLSAQENQQPVDYKQPTFFCILEVQNAKCWWRAGGRTTHAYLKTIPLLSILGKNSYSSGISFFKHHMRIAGRLHCLSFIIKNSHNVFTIPILQIESYFSDLNDQVKPHQLKHLVLNCQAQSMDDAYWGAGQKDHCNREPRKNACYSK